MNNFFKHFKAFMIASLISLAFLTILAIATNYAMVFFVRGQGVVEVPEVTGLTLERARNIAENHSLQIEVADYEYNDVPEGNIIEQIPAKGRTIHKNRKIEVTISRGPKQITIPVLSGFSYQNLSEVFRLYDLKLGIVTQKHSDDIPAGNIIDTVPSFGQTIMAGQPINVIISTGPDPLTTPRYRSEIPATFNEESVF